MLRHDGEQAGDAQHDALRHGLRPHPEGEPGHHDNEAGRDVRLHDEVALAAVEAELDRQARDIGWNGTVTCIHPHFELTRPIKSGFILGLVGGL